MSFIKKYFHLIILLALAAFVFYKCSVFVSRIDTPDLDYNTVYSEGFTEKKFKKIRNRMSGSEVLNSLGKPIIVYKPEYYHGILYANQKLTLECGDVGINIGGADSNVAFILIQFSMDKIVTELFNYRLVEDIREKEIAQNNYDYIINEMGTPMQEMKCDSGYSVWEYSALKEGPHSGKSPKTFIKRIVFKNKIVSKIINTEGNPYDKYIGLCD